MARKVKAARGSRALYGALQEETLAAPAGWRVAKPWRTGASINAVSGSETADGEAMPLGACPLERPGGSGVRG